MAKNTYPLRYSTCGGGNALFIRSPFGWIIDVNGRGSLAILHQRGITLEKACGVYKEWMYLDFWDKKDKINTIRALINWQNINIVNHVKEAIIEKRKIEGLYVRKVVASSYPTPEITVYKDYGNFICFVVLFCPEQFEKRDTRKAIGLLNYAIPGIFKDNTTGLKDEDIKGILTIEIHEKDNENPV